MLFNFYFEHFSRTLNTTATAAYKKGTINEKRFANHSQPTNVAILLKLLQLELMDIINKE